MAEDEIVEELREAAIRTVGRQVDYGKSMYASGKADGAREEREAVVRRLSQSFHRLLQAGSTERDLSVAYAWLSGELRAIEAGEHRKEPDHG